MSPAPLKILLPGLFIFLLGAGLIVAALEGKGSGLLAWGLALTFLSAGLFSVGTWLSRRGGTPLDQRRERRLWKSGPLGRKWLEGRRRIP